MGGFYVAERSGELTAFTVEQLPDGTWTATAAEALTLADGSAAVQSILNHEDDGTPNYDQTERLVTGIVVSGTVENPVLYVTSSDPRQTKSADTNLDTNSGVLTKLTWTGTEWEAVDLIRGLPRSEETHAPNGMALDEETGLLYLAVGGFTNNGAPSQQFTYIAEYALAGTVLEIDLNALDALPVQTDTDGGQFGARDYVYDMPTLDDPNIANDGVREDANGMDVDGPWGGNDGLNQAILPADAPMRI